MYPKSMEAILWLATQLNPQNDWSGRQTRVNYDVFAQAPLPTTTTDDQGQRPAVLPAQHLSTAAA